MDDTFTFIQKEEITNVISVLNNFHKDINFTHEIEKDNIISFLDVKIKKQIDGSFITEVFRKETDTNIYINWNSFAPRNWKIGTLKGLFRRAYLVCSEESGLNKEIKHLKFVFTKINGYPSRVVYNTLQDVIKKLERENNRENNRDNQEQEIDNNSERVTDDIVYPHMCFPYKGKEGDHVFKKFKNYLSKCLPETVKPRFTYKGKKVSSFFHIKDRVKKEHQSDLVYSYTRNAEIRKYNEKDYIGETNVRYGIRTNEHSRTDKQSAIYKDALKNDYTVSEHDFGILAKGYNKSIDRKICEALYIKDYKPRLNDQVNSLKLKLFN